MTQWADGKQGIRLHGPGVLNVSSSQYLAEFRWRSCGHHKYYKPWLPGNGGWYLKKTHDSDMIYPCVAMEVHSLPMTSQESNDRLWIWRFYDLTTHRIQNLIFSRLHPVARRQRNVSFPELALNPESRLSATCSFSLSCPQQLEMTRYRVALWSLSLSLELGR